MSGFIFLEGQARSRIGAGGAEFLAPEGPVHTHSFGQGDRFFIWGDGSGDIHFSTAGRESIAVLCGYISELDEGPEIATQQDAVRIVREALDADASSDALAALAKRIHGSFAIFYRNCRLKLAACVADRVGSRPLWSACLGQGWTVSSHPMAIASLMPSPAIRRGALGAFLLYGGPVHPCRSLFDGVDAVAPGSVTQLHGNGLRSVELWHKYTRRPEGNRSMAGWTDEFAERLVSSAARIARQCGRPAVFFSGGVDSRLTAVALKAVGADPLLVTLGDGRNLEVRISERAAAAIGLEHRVIVRDRLWYFDGVPRAVFESGGSFVWTHGHFSRAAREVKAACNTGTFLLGDFCDALSKLFCTVEPSRRSVWGADEFARQLERIRLPLYRPHDRQRTLALLNPKVRAEVEASLALDVAAHYRTVSEDSADPRIVADRFCRWASVATLPTFSMFLDLRSAVAERNLMFDRDVLDLLEIAPSGVRNGANLGARVIRRLNPAAGAVMNSNSLLPMHWPPAAHSLARKCKPVMGRLRRLMVGDTHRTTGAWPEKSALYVSDPWRGRFEKTLEAEGWLPEELFDRDQVRKCWSDFLNGDRSRASDLEKLVQFAIMTNLIRNGPCLLARDAEYATGERLCRQTKFAGATVWGADIDA